MRNLLFSLLILFFFSCSQEEVIIKKKLVTIGDSLTSSVVWQPLVATSLDLEWSVEETIQGKDGYPRMAFGGTTIRACYDLNEVNPESPSYKGNSIYTRGQSAHYYNPDVILILNTGSEGIAKGNINDDPYFGEELPYNSELINNVVSYPCYKGLIEMVLEKNKKAEIYLMTPPVPRMNFSKFANREEALDYLMTIKYSQVIMVRELSTYYNLHLIDLWELSGITIDNASEYYPEPGVNNEWEVHPNEWGYEKIAEVVSRTLSIKL